MCYHAQFVCDSVIGISGREMMNLVMSALESPKVECLGCDGVGTWYGGYSYELDEYFDKVECEECGGSGVIESEGDDD